MKIINLTFDKITDELLIEPLNVLKNDGVIVLPTETVYGLSVDAQSDQAVARLNRLKGRATVKSYIMVVADLEQAEKHVDFDERARKLAVAFWPGPLTMVLHPKDHTLAKRLGDYEKLSVRVSSSTMVRRLSAMLGSPLVSTSANVSGGDVCYTADEVRQQFEGRDEQPDMIIDSGVLPERSPSTIIDLTLPGVHLLREGLFTQKEIEQVLLS